ncbi:FAD-dependent oxidoreductase [Hymenobacter defluvii]|uniref:FAD-dependent monooxygenase n=1 Tax=Hymenobacter defluvii TaxID=2054411 RepID=A0ABS3TKA0_9BACT|nr:NAD(P)/FAD-dependent oxidoreductase [Hymenobacter defluvii]MBO3273150.1 FAD-dependent monooxygenase [Hymenobacter defluvii]
MKKRIIISGGGIAGLTAAMLLQRMGHEVTVIDRALEFTPAGFLLSLKSFGVTILEQLGLAPALQDASIPAECMDFVDAAGSLISHNSYQELAENTTPSILLTRGGLHQVLYDSIKKQDNLVFGTTVEQVQREGSLVRVILSNHQALEADLLIVAEGLRSATRGTYFKNSYLEDFNVFYVGGRIKKAHSYQVGSFNTIITVDSMLSIYPISREEVAIQCYVRCMDEEGDYRSISRRLLQEKVNGYQPEVQHLLAEFLQSDRFYADKMGMVRAPSLVNDGMVLLGDAGYCPTALSGMGASLSIYGAKALAHFIGQSPDNMALACQQYDALMQPIVEKFQGNARSNAASFLPKDEASLGEFKSAFSSTSESVLQKRLANQTGLTEDQLQVILH